MMKKMDTEAMVRDRAADAMRTVLRLNRVRKKRDSVSMSQRFVFYKFLKNQIRQLRSQKNILQSLYLPANQRLNDLIGQHKQDMGVLKGRFNAVDKLNERFKNLNQRIQLSNLDIAKISEQEKDISTFLIKLNNKIWEQKEES